VEPRQPAPRLPAYFSGVKRETYNVRVPLERLVRSSLTFYVSRFTFHKPLKPMWSFFTELLRRTDGPCTVILMDEEYREQPRQYVVQPRHLLIALGVGALTLTLLVVSLMIFTPLRDLIPGYGTTELRNNAQRAAVRLAALQDSLDAQEQYMAQLRHIMTGQFDTTLVSPVYPTEERVSISGERAEVAAEPQSENWADHQQPALPVARMPVTAEAPFTVISSEGERYLSSLQLPALSPVGGYLTRGFDARTGHYAVDIATEEGTMVRAVGDGYVIFADWTQKGGYAVVVQHADGYVSVYKHNERLLKRVGDRVHSREAVAVSGNSGEFTTGPHLHFELWNNGLAQDPRPYLMGL